MVLAADAQFQEAGIYEHIQYVSGLLTPTTQCHRAGLPSSSLSSGSEAPRRTTGSLQDSTRAANRERHIRHVSFSIAVAPARLSSVQCNKTSLTQSLSAKCCSNTTANDEFPEGHRDSSRGNQEKNTFPTGIGKGKCGCSNVS